MGRVSVKFSAAVPAPSTSKKIQDNSIAEFALSSSWSVESVTVGRFFAVKNAGKKLGGAPFSRQEAATRRVSRAHGDTLLDSVDIEPGRKK